MTPIHVVFGCPRSGTSFLMRAIDAVPGVAGLSGVVYPIGALHLAGNGLEDPARQVLADDLSHALRRYLETGLYRSRWVRLKKWSDTGRRPGGLAAAWRGGEPPRALVFKEPFLSLAPDFVYEALPEARFVHLVRDGRDCARSLVRTYDVLTDAKLRTRLSTEARLGRPYDDRMVPWWVEAGAEDAFMAAPPYVRAAWMWRFMALRARAFLDRPDVRAEGRVLTVRYEAFMRDPQGEGERVAAHFGVDLSPAARRRLATAHEASIGSYSRWDPAEVAHAERVASDALAAWGYRPAAAAVAP